MSLSVPDTGAHAWGGSNLYLRRNGEDITLAVEHRAAPTIPTITLELAQCANALALEVVDRRTPQAPSPAPSTSASLPP